MHNHFNLLSYLHTKPLKVIVVKLTMHSHSLKFYCSGAFTAAKLYTAQWEHSGHISTIALSQSDTEQSRQL